MEKEVVVSGGYGFYVKFFVCWIEVIEKDVYFGKVFVG